MPIDEIADGGDVDTFFGASTDDRNVDAFDQQQGRPRRSISTTANPPVMPGSTPKTRMIFSFEKKAPPAGCKRRQSTHSAATSGNSGCVNLSTARQIRSGPISSTIRSI